MARYLIVAPLGDPGGYVNATYRPAVLPRECRPVEIKYSEGVEKKMSLIAMYECIEKGRCIERTDEKRLSVAAFVIVLESLIQGDEAVKCLGAGSKVDWRCVEQIVKGKIIGKLEQSMSADIVVAPSLGVFSSGVYRGHANNYQAYVLIKLLEKLEKENPDVIVVDTTHGVNWAAGMVIDAVEEAAEIYLAKRGEGELRILRINSDPLVEKRGGEGSGGRELYVHLISCRRKSAQDARLSAYAEIKDLARVGGKVAIYSWLERGGEGKVERSEALSKLDECKEKLLKIAREMAGLIISIENGLLLPMAILMWSISNSVAGQSVCSDIESLVLEALEPEERRLVGNRVEVRRRVAIRVETLSALLKARALLSSVKESLKDVETMMCYREPLRGYKCSKPAKDTQGEGYIFFPLEEIRRLRERYITSGAAEKIASNELGDMRRRLNCIRSSIGRELLEKKPIPWKVIYDITEKEALEGRSYIDMCENLDESFRQDLEISIRRSLDSIVDSIEKVASNTNKPCKYGMPNERNFYAHAGMEKNVTFIYIDDREWIGYETRCWNEHIKNIVLGSI